MAQVHEKVRDYIIDIMKAKHLLTILSSIRVCTQSNVLVGVSYTGALGSTRISLYAM